MFTFLDTLAIGRRVLFEEKKITLPYFLLSKKVYMIWSLAEDSSRNPPLTQRKTSNSNVSVLTIEEVHRGEICPCRHCRRQCKIFTSAHCVLCKVRWHCIFYDAVSDTIRGRGWYRVIITEEGVDTVTYFWGNHGPRVWKSLKLKKCIFRALEQAGTNICSIG